MAIFSVRILLCLLLVTTCAQPASTLPAESAPGEIIEALGPQFRKHETEHFSIHYDTSYETLRPLTARLEGIYDAIERFRLTLDLPAVAAHSRLPIVVFASYKDFAAYAEKAGLSPGGIAGFYRPRTNISAFVDVLDSPSLRPLHNELNRLDALMHRQGTPAALGQNHADLANRAISLKAHRDALVETFNRLVLQHEAAHQVLFNLGVHVRGARTPLWLVEGLACQFEVPQSDANGILKRVNHMRLGDLREALGVQRNATNAESLWRKALEKGTLMPLDELLTAEQFGGDQNQLTARYAQAWSLVHYLHRQHPRDFANYLAVLAARTPDMQPTADDEIEAFESAFGAVDEAFTRAWLTHALRLRYDPAAR